MIVSPASQIVQRVTDFLRGKRVMVTGARGTVGQELVAQLLARFDIEILIGLDHNESELASLGRLGLVRKMDLLGSFAHASPRAP